MRYLAPKVLDNEFATFYHNGLNFVRLDFKTNPLFLNSKGVFDNNKLLIYPSRLFMYYIAAQRVKAETDKVFTNLTQKLLQSI